MLLGVALVGPWPGPRLALGWPLAGPWPGPGWPLAWPWLAFGLALALAWPWLALGLALGWPLAWPWLAREHPKDHQSTMPSAGVRSLQNGAYAVFKIFPGFSIFIKVFVCFSCFFCKFFVCAFYKKQISNQKLYFR